MRKIFIVLLLVFLGTSISGVCESVKAPDVLEETVPRPEPIALHAIDDYTGVGLHWQGWLTIALLALTFAILVSEYLPPDLVMLSGSGILFIAGVLTSSEFLHGFSHDVIFTLAMLFIISRVLDVNGLLGYLVRHVLPNTKNRMRQLLSIMLPISVGSAFLNNTPIVLMLTPIVRRWALDRKLSPSKFLIPLSYAAILGGACSLIGTSSNIIVDGLLREHAPEAGLGFFEFAWVGVPCVIVGLVYMITLGHRLLPNRQDPAVALSRQTREFTGEFRVADDCIFVDKALSEVAPAYFRGEVLIEIQRRGEVVRFPEPTEIIHVGDLLVFAGDIKEIAQLHAIKGLVSLADPKFYLDVTSPYFSEVVISSTSSLIGKTLKSLNFRSYYGASALAVYRQGIRLPGMVSRIVLHAGDTLMLLSGAPWSQEEAYYNNDFYYIKQAEKLPLFVPKKAAFVLIILALMIIAAVLGVPMIVASATAVMVLALSRCITIPEIRQSIRWNVLILVGSAFAFGTAIEKTGVAHYIAGSVIPLIGGNEYLFIAGIFGLTMIVTELITNNAAALLVFPIAIEAARLSGFDSISAMKAVAISVAVASSCSFGTPIGYHTNTIVYGPGGYKFTDYIKVGFPLSVMIFILAVFIIPKVWQMT